METNKKQKTNNSNTYYLIKYCGSAYDGYYNTVVFVTNNKSTATKYVSKFNRILKKWTKYYKQFETNKFGGKWIEKHYIRWYQLQQITKCYYEEVPFR